MNLEGIEEIQIGYAEDGIKLYLNRHDGSGVMIPIDQETHESLEDTFMITELTAGQRSVQRLERLTEKGISFVNEDKDQKPTDGDEDSE